MKSNRIASIIIKSNRELGESFQAYPQGPPSPEATILNYLDDRERGRHNRL